MLTVFVIMTAGIVTGFFFRHRTGWVKRTVMPLICFLLFLLGLEVGSNERIIGLWQTIGCDALTITLGAVLGSVVASWLLWRISGRHNESNN